MKISSGSEKVTMEPSVTSWASPRPATISTSVAMIGCMSSTVTSSPFQSPQISPITRAAATARPDGIARDHQTGRHRACNRHDRADRQIDTLGRDDRRHADGQDRDRRAPVQHVDQAAEKAAVLPGDVEEAGEQQPVDEQNCGRAPETEGRSEAAARRRLMPSPCGVRQSS